MPTNLFAGNITDGFWLPESGKAGFKDTKMGKNWSGTEYVRGLSEASEVHRHPICLCFITYKFLPENIVIFCFQTHRELLTNFQLHAVAWRWQAVSVLGPCLTHAAWLEQNHGFRPGSANPCLKAGCTDGGKNQESYSEILTLRRCLVFKNQISKFTICQVFKISEV